MKYVEFKGSFWPKDGTDINVVDVCDDVVVRLEDKYDIYGSFQTKEMDENADQDVGTDDGLAGADGSAE